MLQPLWLNLRIPFLPRIWTKTVRMGGNLDSEDYPPSLSYLLNTEWGEDIRWLMLRPVSDSGQGGAVMGRTHFTFLSLHRSLTWFDMECPPQALASAEPGTQNSSVQRWGHWEIVAHEGFYLINVSVQLSGISEGRAWLDKVSHWSMVEHGYDFEGYILSPTPSSKSLSSSSWCKQAPPLPQFKQPGCHPFGVLM